ncbi:MAG: hypothetical protein PHR96_00865 [Clostridia bacterium]|nr:hypothetical protein [Clostridia bacterium]
MAGKQKQDAQSENEAEYVTIINKKGYIVSMTMEEAEKRKLIRKTTPLETASGEKFDIK